MKKILLGSTALVFTAGVAAADVTVGGDGYFGVGFGTTEVKDGAGMTTFDDGVFARSNEDGEVEADDYGFVYDLDFDFTGSGETDSGLVFGASADADEIDTSQGPRGFDTEIFVSGDFGTLTMGDISGGVENVTGDLAEVGLTGLAFNNEFVYLIGAGDPACDTTAAPFECGTGPIARYDYNIAGLTLSLGLNDDEGYSVGAGYSGDFGAGGYSLGLGYETIEGGTTVSLVSGDAFDLSDLPGTAVASSLFLTEDADHVVGSASLELGGFGVKGMYGAADTDEPFLDGFDQYGISGTYGFDAFSVSAYWRRVDTDGAGGADDTENDFYGVGATYDLGGGLALEGGITQAELEGAGGGSQDTTLADFGLSFAF